MNSVREKWLSRTLLVVLFLPLVSASSSLPGQSRAGVPDGDRQLLFDQLLDAHNAYRVEHCAAPLEWSPSLAESARRWAVVLAERCRLRHGDSRFGENLFQGTSGRFGPDAVVATWYAEAAEYDYRSPGFRSDTGHFSQLVWKASQRLGCGRATCRGLELWVCRYDPAGNLKGRFRDNVEAPSCRE